MRALRFVLRIAALTAALAVSLDSWSVRQVTAEASAPAVPMAIDGDARIPLPLTATMAAHQKQNMRDHLAAIQEIVTALAADDLGAISKVAARIGYSDQMAQMCRHMGAGAAGFTDMALRFHRTADTIATAAQQGDRPAVTKAVAATLQTCVSCHAAYRQEVVDEASWQRLTAEPVDGR